MIQGTNLAPKEIAVRVGQGVFFFVWWIARSIFFLVEFLLLLRLALFYLTANPDTLVVHWLYRLVDLINYPFRGIFADYMWYGRSIDSTTIASMAGYALAGAVFFAILETFEPKDKVRQTPFQQYH